MTKDSSCPDAGSPSACAFEVHENIAVLVEGDLVALPTIVTGTHTSEYADVPATGSSVKTSASPISRVPHDQIFEH